MSDFTFQRLSPFLVRRQGWHFPPDSWTHAHWCPACKGMHDFAVEQPFRNHAQWSWNQDANKPTMTPSMNIRIGPMPDNSMNICHYFLTNGQIIYLGDCTHDLKGQTVALPPIPDTHLRGAVEII